MKTSSSRMGSRVGRILSIVVTGHFVACAFVEMTSKGPSQPEFRRPRPAYDTIVYREFASVQSQPARGEGGIVDCGGYSMR